MRRRVALIVDHPQRDLAGLVLLARELCRRGVTCYLVPLNNQEHELWSLYPDFVLLNFTRHGTERLAQRLLEAGIDFGLLDTEGAVYAEEIGPDGFHRATFENYTELLWSDRSLLKRVAVVCMWGRRLAEHLTSGGWFTPEQLMLTGCPRFDFYHPRWRPVFDAGLAGKPATPRQILINTWYGISNSQLVSSSGNERQLRDRYQWSEERIRLYIDAERGAIQGFIELVRRLSQDCPGVEILLRPHPFESAEIYRSGLAGLANVRIDGSGPVYPQIFRSSLLVTRGCTTAVEAALAGLPAFSPQWVPTPFVNPISQEVSIPCSDYEALRAGVEEIVAGRFQAPRALAEKVEAVVSDWFYRNDGLAHMRVAEAVLSRLDGPRRVNEELCARFLREHESDRRNRLSARQAIRQLFGVPSEWSFRRMRMERSSLRTVKYFGVPDVKQLIERFTLVSARRGDPAAEPTVRLAAGAPLSHRKGHARSVTLESASADTDVRAGQSIPVSDSPNAGSRTATRS